MDRVFDLYLLYINPLSTGNYYLSKRVLLQLCGYHALAAAC